MAADASSGRKQYKWTKDSSVAFVAHFGKRSGGQLRTEPVAAAQSQAEDSEPSAAAGGSSSARLNSSTLNSTLIDPVEADVPELYLVRTSDGATSGGQEAELVISVSIPLGCVERSFVLKLLCLVGTSRVHVSHSFLPFLTCFQFICMRCKRPTWVNTYGKKLQLLSLQHTKTLPIFFRRRPRRPPPRGYG